MIAFSSRAFFTSSLVLLVAAAAVAASRVSAPVAVGPVVAPPVVAPPVVAPPVAPTVEAIAGEAPVIEVVFALDTTGSMAGLIEGAKEKIWAVVDQFASGQPRPEIRIGLVAFRDRGDDYVTRVTPLTSDLDAVYAALLALQAGGGGDGPESVNQALAEAVGGMQWTRRAKVYRAVFVVGDAPPHTDYGDVQYAETVATARQQDIYIHTVLCGGSADARGHFAAMAKAGGGSLLEVVQSGGMAAVETPLDAELARLNREIAATAVAWGSAAEQHELTEKIGRGSSAPSTRAAARTSYLSKAGGKVNSGRKDLVDALTDGDVTLADVAPAELPANLQGKPPEQQKAWVDGQAARRVALKAEVTQRVAERDRWIALENARLAKEGKADGFDAKMRDSVIGQVEALGYASY